MDVGNRTVNAAMDAPSPSRRRGAPPGQARSPRRSGVIALRFGRALGLPRGSAAFTLIELMVVILILAVLVAIAVAVAVTVRRTAWNSAAKYNYRAGCSAMDSIWVYFSGLQPTATTPPRYDRYYDGYGIWAQSMSRYEKKIRWVDVRRAANNRLYQYGTWKNNVLQPNTRDGTTYYYDWSKMYGRVGVYRGYRNAANTAWTNSATTGNTAYAEVTVIVLTEGSNRAYYTSYRFGSVIAAGQFTWAPGTGDTTSFGEP